MASMFTKIGVKNLLRARKVQAGQKAVEKATEALRKAELALDLVILAEVQKRYGPKAVFAQEELGEAHQELRGEEHDAFMDDPHGEVQNVIDRVHLIDVLLWWREADSEEA